jgi:NAD(P)-dependent dehydrogenase (short-subunit alcohol dehydrogenase family)
MSYDLNGKSILITGAGSGIGQAAARKLAQEGAKVALVDVNAAGLETTRKEILAACPGAEVLVIVADVSDEKAVENFVTKTQERFGRIDGFYNNAGIEGPHADMADYGGADFDKVTNVNVKGVYYGLKHVIRVMQAQKSGAIVNVASVAGIRAVKRLSAYVASKHAVVGLTKAAAAEYGEWINVNAIAPGGIMTNMLEEAFRKIGGDNWRDALAEFTAPNPKKRMGTPEEVSELVAFLLSDKAGYINGAIIAIDGGQSQAF